MNNATECVPLASNSTYKYLRYIYSMYQTSTSCTRNRKIKYEKRRNIREKEAEVFLVLPNLFNLVSLWHLKYSKIYS